MYKCYIHVYIYLYSNTLFSCYFASLLIKLMKRGNYISYLILKILSLIRDSLNSWLKLSVLDIYTLNSEYKLFCNIASELTKDPGYASHFHHTSLLFHILKHAFNNNIHKEYESLEYRIHFVLTQYNFIRLISFYWDTLSIMIHSYCKFIMTSNIFLSSQ